MVTRVRAPSQSGGRPSHSRMAAARAVVSARRMTTARRKAIRGGRDHLPGPVAAGTVGRHRDADTGGNASRAGLRALSLGDHAAPAAAEQRRIAAHPIQGTTARGRIQFTVPAQRIAHSQAGCEEQRALRRRLRPVSCALPRLGRPLTAQTSNWLANK